MNIDDVEMLNEVIRDAVSNTNVRKSELCGNVCSSLLSITSLETQPQRARSIQSMRRMRSFSVWHLYKGWA